MHPTTTELFVREHIATMHREARNAALARARSAQATAPRTTAAGRATWHPDDRFHLMPHVQEGGRLRRAITAILRPLGA
jgi:hypothetical protein